MIAIPPGEQSKSLTMACHIMDELASSQLGRRDVLIAVGGGVVIDTVGWVASSYMRGIPYINVPTTLLAQVDAAIGGKVAVDHPTAKNLIGAFYEPQAVVSCVSYLSTLDPRHVRAGLAEAIKVAVIASPELFDLQCADHGSGHRPPDRAEHDPDPGRRAVTAAVPAGRPDAFS
jgi:3-dehydroquinate synthase